MAPPARLLHYKTNLASSSTFIFFSTNTQPSSASIVQELSQAITPRCNAPDRNNAAAGAAAPAAALGLLLLVLQVLLVLLVLSARRTSSRRDSMTTFKSRACRPRGTCKGYLNVCFCCC